MSDPASPRDLLAERIRRLDQALVEITERVGGIAARVERACAQLDELVTLVGRLSRVVDAQGSTLVVDESELAERVARVEARLDALPHDDAPQPRGDTEKH